MEFRIGRAWWLGIWLLTASAARGAPPSLKSATKTQDFAPAQVARIKYTSILGANVVQGTAFVIGGQFGFAPFINRAFYIGPEFLVSLYESNVYIFTPMMSAWYEVRVSTAPNLSLMAGASGGLAYSRGFDAIPGVTYATYLNLGVIHDIDDLVSIRGEFRPGLIDQWLAFMMNFNVSFRF